MRYELPATLGAALLLAASASNAQAFQSELVITDVDVVDVISGELITDQTVHVQDGRIESITSRTAGTANAVRIDGSGKYLIPGLWDMHVHLRNRSAPDLLMPQFIAHGVTGVRDMGSDCEEPSPGATCAAEMLEWRDRIDEGTMLGPRLVGISSFVVNPPWDFDVTRELARETVQRIDERGVDHIKVYYRLSIDGLRLLVEEAGRHGLTVSGHLPIRSTAVEASDAGIRSVEHARDFLFDCFPESDRFRSGTLSQNPPMELMRSMVDDHDVEHCDETFRTFVANDTWYVPTHVTRRMDAYADDPDFRSDARQRFIPAQAWEAWNADADRMVALDPSPEGRRTMRGFYERGLEITGRAHAAGVPIALGTDAGDTYVFPGSSVHDELGEFVKAGLTPAEALAAATIRSAEFLAMDDDYGSVERGKHADLVLLDANPLEDIENVRRIASVIFRGEVIDRVELTEMLDEVVEAIAAIGR